ncbi:MAG: hypothetical protein ACK4SL_02740 [Candidatus Paceibacteria bacterium]
MMKLTQSAIQEIRASLVKPLQVGELRQIEAMGNLFVSIKRFPEDDHGVAITNDFSMDYWFQYSLKIDDTMYYFYGGTPVA